MSSAPLTLAARRAWGRLSAHVAALWRALEPWRRREAWTQDGLRRAFVAARRQPGRTAVAAASLAAAFSLAAWALWPHSSAGVALATVQEGPFHVGILETGTIQALRSMTYASSILSNQAKIVAMAPEGKMVGKGDLLILFDSSPFEDEIRRNEALLAQAQADLLKAKQDLKLQAIQNQEEVSAARLKVERSALELKDVQQGKGKVKEEEAQAAVGNAERDLQKAKSQLEDLRPLLAEGFITKVELERQEQAVSRASEDLALAKRRRDALLDFGRPLEVTQAQSDAQSSRESYRQLESAVSYRMAQKQAAIDAAESRIQEASSKLDLARQQLAHCEVKADVPGIVVYKDVFFGSEQRKPQVGDQVWANQPLLILPDISRMVVETRIRETDIHKVAQNQQVRVRVEAYPDLKLTGQVTLVGTLAQEEKDRRGAKFFGVTVQVKESDARLRPGMTAHVEIQVEERATARYVPLEAVFERQGRTVAYVRSGGRPREREVVLGPSNQDFVVVEQGLAAGERVYLRDPEAPPSDFGGVTQPSSGRP